MIKPLFTIQDIKYSLDNATFQRAKKLFDGGKVKKIIETPHGYQATIEGTSAYKVSLSIKHVDKGYCDCYIFNSQYAGKLAFLGGTALRIVYGSTRFSEDLDFDNFDLTEAEFTDLSLVIQKDLILEGLEVEVNTVARNAYRIKIRIPKLLFDSRLSAMVEQRILIQVDTVPQNFEYEIAKPLLNKFDIFTQINAVPKDLLLAQKIFAAVNCKRIMGRDFFDIVFLYGIGARPNFAYLKKNIGVGDAAGLKKYLLEMTSSLNFEELARDVEPLLFDPRDKKKVLLFREFVEQW